MNFLTVLNPIGQLHSRKVSAKPASVLVNFSISSINRHGNHAHQFVPLKTNVSPKKFDDTWAAAHTGLHLMSTAYLQLEIKLVKCNLAIGRQHMHYFHI